MKEYTMVREWIHPIYLRPALPGIGLLEEFVPFFLEKGLNSEFVPPSFPISKYIPNRDGPNFMKRQLPQLLN
jgi:hypothetical protein